MLKCTVCACVHVGKVAHRLHMAKVTNYVLAERDSEPYYIAVHIPGSKVNIYYYIFIIVFIIIMGDIIIIIIIQLVYVCIKGGIMLH